MELDDLSKSGIRRIADYSPYLDQLAGLAEQMGLRQRSNLTHVESCLRRHWALGQNIILSWAPLDKSILILVVPHYAIAEYTSKREGDMPPRVSPRFITELISGDRKLTISQMQKVARLLEIEPGFDYGLPHMLRGMFDALRPRMLGGQPDSARVHFERAFELSHGQNQLYRVMYAEYYCRQVLDVECFDSSLDQVESAGVSEIATFHLMNEIARRRAQRLRAIRDDLF